VGVLATEALGDQILDQRRTQVWRMAAAIEGKVGLETLACAAAAPFEGDAEEFTMSLDIDDARLQ